MPPASPAPDIWTQFRAFSAFHWVTLAVCIGLIAGACALGRRWRAGGGDKERRLRHGWAWLILLSQVPAQYFYIVLHWKIQLSLPLHVCDLAVFLAAGALLTEARWVRTMLYFWGLGLSTQGFITPVVTEGLSSGWFWFFWIVHLQIVGSAVYLIAVMEYRPRGRDLGVAVALSAVYVAVMIPFNLALGVNYGYVGNRVPGTPTLIDRLGTWPGRLITLAAIVGALYAAMWLVWPVAARFARGRSTRRASGQGPVL